MKKLLFSCMIMFSCVTTKTDITQTKAYKQLPSCLIVKPLPWSWQEKTVQDAIDEINKDVGFRAIKIFPNCEPTDELVIFEFVIVLPPNCGERGCLMTFMDKGEIKKRRIEIHENAPYSTIIHELRHLIGCKHGNSSKPCYMGHLFRY